MDIIPFIKKFFWVLLDWKQYILVAVCDLRVKVYVIFI